MNLLFYTYVTSCLIFLTSYKLLLLNLGQEFDTVYSLICKKINQDYRLFPVIRKASYIYYLDIISSYRCTIPITRRNMRVFPLHTPCKERKKLYL